MRKLGIAIALVAVVALPAAASARSHGRVSTYDAYWLKSSAQGDAFEVKSGTIARSKGSDQSIKAVGAMLVKDHSKSLSDVKKLARRLGIKVEASPTPTEHRELEVTQTLSGASFDQWWAKLEVKDHIQDIEDTSEEIHSGSNPAIRAEARKDLPDAAQAPCSVPRGAEEGLVARRSALRPSGSRGAGRS